MYGCKFDKNMALSIRPCIRKLYTASSIASAESRDFPSLQNPNQKSNQLVNTSEINSQLKDLVRTGRLNDARQMFDKLPQRDVVSWTTVIAGYINAFDGLEALSLFSTMWVDPAVGMDPFVLSLALKTCGLSSSARHGKLLHGYCVKSGFVNSVFVGSALLDMYAKNGKINEGCRVFDEMTNRNVVSWTAIITGLVRAGYGKDGLMYFADMLMDGVEHDSYTFAIALKACADACLLNHGREIHGQAIKKGFDRTSFVANTLATMYNKCGKIEYGLSLFEKMSIQDVVSWTSLITTYVHMGKAERAIQTYLRMRVSEVCPNAYTFAAVITACEKIATVDLGVQLHAHVLSLGFVNSLSVANSIMTMYSRCGQLSLASNLFLEMGKKDIVSWSTIIAGYAQGGYGEETFHFLSLMRREGPKPTEFAFGSALSVCGNMAILEQGKQLHAHILSVGLDHTAMVRSGLINMYSKCGTIQEASKVFNETENDDIVSWTAMINGYAEHGFCQEAIDLFEKMIKAGLRPDAVTLIGVLSACSHAGKVDLGFHYFNLIQGAHRIKLSKEHYGCMIDLLCRAGCLSEAEKMIEDMPFHCDDVVWSILLRACSLHGDVDRGIRASKKILKLNPNCATTHITLANVYSAKRRWREAAEVRKLMRSEGVIKEPGWSWIKVLNQVSVFVAGDSSHPESNDIYRILELMGSSADIHILHDVETYMRHNLMEPGQPQPQPQPHMSQNRTIGSIQG